VRRVTADEVALLGPERWRELLRAGHPIEPRSIEGWAYRGTSLGLPAIVERATWKRFQKAFHRDAATGRLRGWNVRTVQRIDRSRSEPMRARDGTPRTFGPFDVVHARGRGVPHGFDRGLLLDYGCGPRLDPTSRLRDPIVALHEGDGDLLLGWSYLTIAGRAIDTPSFFVLEREHRIEHVPE